MSGQATMRDDMQQDARRKGAARTAIVLGLVAFAFYVTFFVTKL